MYSLTLPWPPSVNHYYRRVGNRTLISREGREFRRRFERLCATPDTAGDNDNGNKKPPRLALMMDAFPPDRRRRDLDNLQKSLLDSLEHAGLYEDDSQVDLLIARRQETCRPKGKIIVRIDEMPLQRCPLCGHALLDETEGPAR